MYGASTNFRLEIIEPSAREEFIFWTLVEKEERWASEKRRNSARAQKNVDASIVSYASIGPSLLLSLELFDNGREYGVGRQGVVWGDLKKYRCW